MKANELMIGDWVKDKYKPEPHRVDSWADFNSAEDLSPIPLTYKILKKNGWRHHATYGSVEDETLEEIYMLYQYSFEVIFNNKEAISIRHFVSKEDDGYDKLLINYCDNGHKPICVHTLQHALRLYGLDELADNFKV